MGLRKFWKVETILILLGIVAIIGVISACTTNPATVTATTTVTSAPTTVTVTATPPANPDLAKLKQLAGPPPASLDQYFPPIAPAPLFLVEMFNMAGPFEGIGIGLQEGDTSNLKINFQAFAAEYTKISKMVPEWASLFPQGPVDALSTAINSGNPAQIGPAMGNVGQICGTCHLINQVKVQQKYHWKNFDDIKIKDPISGQTLAWVDYKTAMAGSFEGALVDLAAGKLDNARKNFNAFSAQFKTMATDGCKECHQDPTGKEIPRKYYVDVDSMAIIAQMGTALASTPPDAATIGNLSGAIGNDICVNCHLVHMPAQVAKDSWEQNAALFK